MIVLGEQRKGQTGGWADAASGGGGRLPSRGGPDGARASQGWRANGTQGRWQSLGGHLWPSRRKQREAQAERKSTEEVEEVWKPQRTGPQRHTPPPREGLRMTQTQLGTARRWQSHTVSSATGTAAPSVSCGVDPGHTVRIKHLPLVLLAVHLSCQIRGRVQNKRHVWTHPRQNEAQVSILLTALSLQHQTRLSSHCAKADSSSP